MIALHDTLKAISQQMYVPFEYNRRLGLNKSIDDLEVPIIALIEPDEFALEMNSVYGRGTKDSYTINIQFLTFLGGDIDMTATERLPFHDNAIILARRFVQRLQKESVYTMPARATGITINNAYDVKAVGIELSLTLTARDTEIICL